MSLQDLLFRNVWMKLFSILLATLIWFTVKANLSKVQGEEAERSIDRLPVLVMTAQRPTRGFFVEPNYVSVTVRGPVSRIAQLRANEVHAFVRLPLEPPDATPIALDVQVHVPHGMSVTRIEPHAVLLRAN